MKKFILGALCATLIFSLSISALAISGRMTIEVSPINIQVNGETFVPKDVNGTEVPVFAYQGTTYAPLRALAEAYGLEVGYDQATNMATVVDPEAHAAPVEDTKTTFGSDWSAEKEAEYQEFKAMWELVEIKPSDHKDGLMIYVFTVPSDKVSDDELISIRANKWEYTSRMIIEYAVANGAKQDDALGGDFMNDTTGFFMYPAIR